MEKYQHIENQNKNEIEHINEEILFTSDLGKFSHIQDRIIRFGLSKKMLILTILLYIVFLIDIVSTILVLSTDLTFSYVRGNYDINWIKVPLGLLLVMAFLLPFGASQIRIGSKKKKVNIIAKGISIIRAYVVIYKGIVVLLAVLSVIIVFSLSMSAFLLVVFLGATLFGIFYFFFKFIKQLLQFIDDLLIGVTSNNQEEINYPSANELKIYFIFLLVIQFFSWLVSLLRELTGAMGYTTNFVDSFETFNFISFIVQMALYIYVINLTGVFDHFIREGRPTFFRIEPDLKVTEKVHPVKRDEDNEDQWRMKF